MMADLYADDQFFAVYPGDKQRFRRVERHQHLVEELLASTGYQALLLTMPENFVWFTAGGDWRAIASSEVSRVALFISPQHRVVLCEAALSLPLFGEQIPALGFELKERTTVAELEDLYDEVCRGRSVMSDSGFGRTRDWADRIDELKARSQ